MESMKYNRLINLLEDSIHIIEKHSEINDITNINKEKWIKTLKEIVNELIANY